jgi:hypothetical protein
MILLIVAMLAVQPGELIERTLAIVGGQAITLSDVRTALSLRLIESADSGEPLPAATERLVQRTLVLREVDRYAPPQPAETIVDARLSELRGRFATADEFTRTLAAGGFTDERLRAWVRDDLRIAAYLDQRFAAVGAPTDEEVTASYAARRGEFERQQITLEQAAPGIRERLAADRRTQLIADWVDDLRRRTTVVELWKIKP